MPLYKTAHGRLLTSLVALGFVGIGIGLRAESASHVKTADHSVHAAHSMSLGPADESFDLRFIDAMIPHHEGAVIMAKEALEKSQRPEIRQLAEAILAAQSEEIEQMQAWRLSWYPEAPRYPLMWHEEMGHMMAMTPETLSDMRMDSDLGSADDQFDLRFMEAMILHHEGAVIMAEEALQKSQRPEILQLAEAILASQQAEIDQMRAWQQQWYPQ
ncbi:DUF305 domain-containing protein [Thermostichus vulcanus]|uniref:DUF305 domain-containing protein n=1 Tax=Thermostichus vulcanus str. 'Rupite' TaxID=2813851 RepID=A0ABT0C7E4_THEVL|nr:DUF305 domain-containing protein [Thermostichus vulcanus]MCJ2541654.1 DUF305 domain-containing protein [Thermostichus vulcanus str. 'Rupite']